MTAPDWLAASTGSQAVAGQVNQFLTTHAVQYLYTGHERSSQFTAGSGGDNTDGLWLAQSFSTSASQTAIGYIVLELAVTGSPAPVTFNIETNNSGAPSGTVLQSTELPKEFLSGSASAQQIMIPVTGLSSSTTYWIVSRADGDASDYFTWSKSNQTSGASTSTNGTSWTAQTYGFMYQVWDQDLVLPLQGTYEDNGDRWIALTYTGTELTGIAEFTVGQVSNGYAASNRTLSYTNELLTGVA